MYLALPSTAAQALSLILGTVGPMTAIDYLNFAIGKPIREAEESEPKAAVGLEALAQEIEVTSDYEASTRASSIRHHDGLVAQEPEGLSQRMEDLNIKKEDPSVCFSDNSDFDCHEPCFHYGAVSDKIGETIACWLARWGVDILAYEDSSYNFPPSISGIRYPASTPKADFPVVWNRGGLSAKWVSALVSSDALFVKGERERYEFAKRVVDLRRRSGMDADEEKEWTHMFSTLR